MRQFVILFSPRCSRCSGLGIESSTVSIFNKHIKCRLLSEATGRQQPKMLNYFRARLSPGRCLSSGPENKRRRRSRQKGVLALIIAFCAVFNDPSPPAWTLCRLRRAINRDFSLAIAASRNSLCFAHFNESVTSRSIASGARKKKTRKKNVANI